MDPDMMNSMAQFGLMQKISTGNMYLDLLLCLLLPAVGNFLMPHATNLWCRLTSGRNGACFCRYIKFVKREGKWYYDTADGNHILQEAVLMFIGSQTELMGQLKEADVDLIRTKQFALDGADCDSNDDGSSEDVADPVGDLRSYCVNMQPPEGTSVEVAPGVTFRRDETVEDFGRDRDSRHRTITFSVTSKAADGHRRIAVFLERALEHYRVLQTAKKDDARYLYMPFSRALGDGDDGAGAGPSMVYKRYKLSDDKTFACYYHADKAQLLRLVDDFVRKSGKFAIQGYPHKLGLLLYGPPGTGKTSFIKALAHYTGRSIVSVPLSKVKTNQELMDIMFDQSFHVQGETLPLRLPHSKVLFVMDDIDAAGAVVLRRAADGAAARAAMLAHEAPGLHAQLGGNNGQTRQPGEAGRPIRLEKDTVGHMAPLPIGASLWKDNSDELNLAGILNVLDGVVDCPERIVVMTTNHPEKLDPALVRPGRINHKLYLGYMRPAEAALLVGHHFPEASEEALSRVQAAVPFEALVPAKLEAMCAEHDSVDSLVEALASGQYRSRLMLEDEGREGEGAGGAGPEGVGSVAGAELLCAEASVQGAHMCESLFACPASGDSSTASGDSPPASGNSSPAAACG